MTEREHSPDAVNHTKKIHELNDALRKTLDGGKLVMTRGVIALGAEVIHALTEALQSYDNFSAENDPYGEHDFGAMTVMGHDLIFKIDYFDLDRAGAITGTLAAPGGIAFANYTGKNFVIKAEQSNAAGTYRVVRRATTIRPDGTFTLYPLPIFGNATTARYDIVIRGRNVETCVVNQVPAHKGTVPATGTSLGPPVSLTTGNEYVSSVTISPTGAWTEYYQTLNLPGEIPYEIRFRHANPFTGSFFEPLQLSSGPLHVGNWSNGGAVTFASMTPVGLLIGPVAAPF